MQYLCTQRMKVALKQSSLYKGYYDAEEQSLRMQSLHM